jgi:hypothetical protein
MLDELAKRRDGASLDQIAASCEACLQHMEVVDEMLVPVLQRAGAGEDDLRKTIAWHDLARIALVALQADWDREQDQRAKRAIFLDLMADLLKREQAPDTGLLALSGTLEADLGDLVPHLQSAAQTSREDQSRQGVSSGRGLTTRGRWRPPDLHVLRLKVQADRSERPKSTTEEDEPMGRYDDERYGGERRFGGRGRPESYESGYSGRQGGEREPSGGGMRRSSPYRSDDQDDRGYRHMSERYDERGNDDRRHSGYGRSHDDDDRNERRYSTGGRDRDEYYRYGSDDDYRGHGPSRDREEGHEGGPSRYSGNDRPRDAYGRFVSDDESNGRRYTGRSRHDDDDDDDHRGHGGWYGDRQGNAEAARRGWEDRRR